MGITETINTAQELAKTDLAGAIAMLDQERSDPAFYPWLSFSLVRLLRGAGKRAEAFTEAESLLKVRPDFTAGLTEKFALARGDDRYLACVAECLDFITRQSALREKWLFTWYLEVALFAEGEQLERILAPALAGHLINGGMADGLRRCAPYLAELRTLLADTGGVSALRDWTFRFAGPGPRVAIDGATLTINLSGLNLPPTAGWEAMLAAPFVAALVEVLRPVRYLDDWGVSSWPHATSADTYSVVWWQLLRGEGRARTGTKSFSVGLPSLHPGPRQCWMRPGSVELFALWSRLHDGQTILEQAEETAQALLDAAASGIELPQTTNWWQRTDAAQNLIRLNTNAGWYAKPGRAAAAFADWADRYAAALTTGRLIAATGPDILRVTPLLPSLRDSDIRHWNSDEPFLSALHKRRVVFVTSFAAEIAEHYAAGGLASLWRDVGVSSKLAALETVEAPMSIWPYYPDTDWTVTFEKLFERSCAAIEKSGADLFLASCGAYGLPLVHAIHKKFGIASIYYGHAMNCFFGVYTEAFSTAPFYQRAMHSPHWLRPNLATRYAAISKIDDGRYVVAS